MTQEKIKKYVQFGYHLATHSYTSYLVDKANKKKEKKKNENKMQKN
jgi:hypothetical protein